ncbi:hypothetical protein V6N13_024707 [Hibiscus sabdariffa]
MSLVEGSQPNTTVHNVALKVGSYHALSVIEVSSTMKGGAQWKGGLENWVQSSFNLVDEKTRWVVQHENTNMLKMEEDDPDGIDHLSNETVPADDPTVLGVGHEGGAASASFNLDFWNFVWNHHVQIDVVMET